MKRTEARRETNWAHQLRLCEKWRDTTALSDVRTLHYGCAIGGTLMLRCRITRIGSVGAMFLGESVLVSALDGLAGPSVSRP